MKANLLGDLPCRCEEHFSSVFARVIVPKQFLGRGMRLPCTFQVLTMIKTSIGWTLLANRDILTGTVSKPPLK